MQKKRSIRLGIFGGGQLALMLAQNNPYSDLEVHVFSEEPTCPASFSDTILTVGSSSDIEAVQNFVEKVDFITFENEFLNMDLFAEVQKATTQKLFFPQIPVLKTVQNKLYQKFVFQKLQIPTARFDKFDSHYQNISDWIQTLLQKFPKGCVVKWARGGYDGKGNYIYNSPEQFHGCLEFCHAALAKSVDIYAEEKIAFSKEVAMIYARSLKTEFVHYPLVITEQNNNVCELVYGPATEFGVDENTEKLAADIGKKIANEFSYVGVFALEFFLTQEGELLVNEMAPRVHNSGHYTLDACLLNQFSCHLKAGLGSDLVSPTTFPFFAMLNILGKKKLQEVLAPQAQPNDPFKVYWYGKKGSTPGRKLGHINTVGTSKSDIESKIKKMRDFERSFDY
jgi:5-(carboxyamino)imidazole ribonucleotide synthase